MAPPLPGPDAMRDTCKHGFTRAACAADPTHFFDLLSQQEAESTLLFEEGRTLLDELGAFPFTDAPERPMLEGERFV